MDATDKAPFHYGHASASAEGSIEMIDVNMSTKQGRDVTELARWGKKQQLKRTFNIISMVGLTCCLMISWEGFLVTFVPGLSNGGPAGLVYGWLFVWIGNILQCLVMAELASMMPLAGGQYNWVALLAPPSCSKFLSFLTGWITFISWQATLASSCYLAGTVLQGLLILNYPDTYVPRQWHGVLLMYAILLLNSLINIFLVRLLPHIESLSLFVHIAGFLAVIVPLVHLGPHGSAHDVFTQFINSGDWPTKGLSWFTGLTGTMFAFIGIDAASHMAEEIKEATTVIPRSMIASVAINGTLGFAMVIAAMFCLGDVDSVLDTPTGFPFLQLFYNATETLPGVNGMTSVILVMVFLATVGILATTCRMTWAFAREKAMPLSKYLARVDRRTAVPLYSLLLSALITLLLALINIGSGLAFTALTSLTIAGFYSSYSIAACVLLHRRLTSAELPYGPFRLGRFQIPIIILSLAYSLIGFFFSFWPGTRNPTAQEMNWSVVVYVGFVGFGLVYWGLRGRKVYKGPIIEVKLRERIVAGVR